MTQQHRALRVDAQSFFEVNFCQVELLLFVVDHAQTIPVGINTPTCISLINTQSDYHSVPFAMVTHHAL